MVICLERVADLHMSQPMPLPLTVSCFSKIQIVFAFLVPVYPGSPGKRAVKWVRSCNILVLKVIFKAVSFEASTILLKKRFISLSHFAANFCSNCCKWQKYPFLFEFTRQFTERGQHLAVFLRRTRGSALARYRLVFSFDGK